MYQHSLQLVDLFYLKIKLLASYSSLLFFHLPFLATEDVKVVITKIDDKMTDYYSLRTGSNDVVQIKLLFSLRTFDRILQHNRVA